MKTPPSHPTIAPAVIEPVAMTVPNAVRFSGIGRSTLYKLLGAGLIEARKLGGRTLIVTASLKSYVAGLPSAFPKPEAE